MIVCDFPTPKVESHDMSEPSQAILSDRVHRYTPAPDVRVAGMAVCPAITVAIHDDLAAVEADWRRFEETADCTVFQTFDWLSAWQRHIGQRNGVTPAIVVGQGADGRLLFLIPLAVAPGVVRRLTFLGSDLCDYNAPLLAPDFSDQVKPPQFLALWAEICSLLQRHPRCHHDLIDLTKMPETVGRQCNPFAGFDVRLHPSGAHFVQLQGTWDEFYRAKRSSATRRRDRSKRKRLSESGELRFVTASKPDEVARALTTLIEQKDKAFARMGVTSVFAPPGHRDFYFDLATDDRMRHLVHISRLDVGAVPAAVNLGLTFRGSYYHVLASYDDGELARFGPGTAHLRDLLCYAIGRHMSVFDFTVGDEPYKLEWSDGARHLYDCTAPATARGWPAATLARCGRHIKRSIKQNPVLWTVFSRLRAALHVVRFGRSDTHEPASRG
jgi:CelD/BcsL family acetyltransferase involved in cellulose biosynthesis